MENRKPKPSIREKLQQAKEEITSQRQKKPDEWNANPYVKSGMYVASALFIVWASQFVFAAFEGAIRQFKKLRKTIREN